MTSSILDHHGDGFIHANGLRLHYEQWGDGPHVVIALHGTSLHGRVWAWLAASLGPEYRLIGLDQRSHGDSQRAGSGQYQVEHYGADLEAFIDRLGLERVSLVGSSLGSRVALWYAARHPRKVAALALLDLSFEMPTEASEHMVSAHLSRPRRFADMDAALAFSRTLPQRRRFSDEVHLRTLQGDLRRLDDGQLEWRYDRDAAIETLRCAARDMWDSVRAIEAPTTILRGADSDVLIAPTVQRLQRELRGLHMLDVPDAGHSIWGDNPQFTARAIEEALRRARPAPAAESEDACAPAPLSWTQGRPLSIATGSLRFHALEWGQPNAPALVCLHGTSMQASAWSALGSALSAHWRVIAIDMRGHGQSDKPASGYALTDYADDLRAIFDALGLAQASLIGSSLGTQVAMAFAARHPQRVQRLVLSDPSCLIAQQAIDQYVALHRSRPRSFTGWDEALAFSHSLPQRRRFSPEVHRFTLQGDLGVGDDGRLHWRYALDPILQTFEALTVDQSADIAATRAPVLILRGSESHVLSRPDALRLLDAFPQAELVEIGECGHTIWGDQPQVMAQHVQAFLA